MNVHADNLATDYLNKYADPSTISPFITTSQYIQRSYPSTIRQPPPASRGPLGENVSQLAINGRDNDGVEGPGFP